MSYYLYANWEAGSGDRYRDDDTRIAGQTERRGVIKAPSIAFMDQRRCLMSPAPMLRRRTNGMANIIGGGVRRWKPLAQTLIQWTDQVGRGKDIFDRKWDAM